MGQYLIPGVPGDAVSQAIEHVRAAGSWHDAQVWDHGVEGGILFVDPLRDDAGCAALYAGFTYDPAWRPPIHEAMRTHLGHLRDYEQSVRSGGTPTAAHTQHVIADIITFLRLQDDRL